MTVSRGGFHLSGDDVTVANILELGSTFGGAALDASMRKGLNVVKKSAQIKAKPRRQAHTPNGMHLDQLMRVRKEPRRPRNNPKLSLGFIGRGVKIAHLVEFGTEPHWQPRRGVMHPGAQPFPFMRPAFEETGNQAVSVVLNDMKDQLERVTRRMAARAGVKRR